MATMSNPKEPVLLQGMKERFYNTHSSLQASHGL